MSDGIIPDSREQAEEGILRIPARAAGTVLSDWLTSAGFPLQLPCGGRGICGGCSVTLADGRKVRACSFRVPDGGVGVFLPSSGVRVTGAAAVQAPAGAEKPDMALDIGTTTLELALTAPDGSILSSVTALNPQIAFGADVLSRISACSEGKLGELRSSLAVRVNSMIHELSPSGAGRLFAVGNPTMTHILCGISPECLGSYPFKPAFTGRTKLSREDSMLDAEVTELLPSVSAFIGSDLVAGLCVSGLGPGADPGFASRAPVLFSDLGTNGETALIAGGRILCASAAAGPALEGAGISCGTGGVPGAVCSVFPGKGGNAGLGFRTVGGVPPSGICGSGLCDLIACLLDAGRIDRTGCLSSPGGFALCPGVLLTQKDVRSFQLAQSAVRATVETLISAAGIEADDILSAILAGGLGSRISPESAIRTGILPRELSGRIRAAGNTALRGAAACAAEGFIEKTEKTASACETVDLTSSVVFGKAFIGGMIFP